MALMEGGFFVFQLADLIKKKIMEDDSSRLIFELIEKEGIQDGKAFIEDILDRYYKEDDPKKVLSVTKNRKLSRRKKEWYDNAISGYQHFLKTKEIKRGVYRHLVDHYLWLKEIEMEKGSVFLNNMVGAHSPEKAMDMMIEKIEQWRNDEDRYLIEYPFFQSFSVKLKKKSLEVDGILLVGKAFIEVVEEQGRLLFKGETDEGLDDESLKTYVKKMPSIFLDTPISAISGQTKYEVDQEKVIHDPSGELVEVKTRRSFELAENYKMYVDRFSLKAGTKSIQTPDMTDERLFVKMLEHRDPDFQKNKRIFVYLNELLLEFYGSDNAKNYKNLRERLFRLGFFRVARIYNDGVVKIRSLFDTLDIDKDENNRWYVHGKVSDTIWDIIVRDNFVKIYSEKINELKSDLAHHLAFIIQKERILHHEKGKDTIVFRLKWNDFLTSIRMNKRSKEENMKEIAKGLSEIREKNFLIKDFQRDTSYSFLIQCYTLNEYELKDRVSIHSIFSKPSSNLLLEDKKEI